MLKIECPLLPLTSENSKKSDEARLDVSARGFWQRGQRAFIDDRVFNPYSQGHQNERKNKPACL